MNDYESDRDLYSDLYKQDPKDKEIKRLKEQNAALRDVAFQLLRIAEIFDHSITLISLERKLKELSKSEVL